MHVQPTYLEFGKKALLIIWEDVIDEATNDKVLQMDSFISENFRGEILETVPAYSSLAVYLKEGVPVSSFIERIKSEDLTVDSRVMKTKSVVTIPVCYAEKYALDLEHVAKFHNISTSEVIKIHTQPVYKVYFLGFLPGFPYLGGLDTRLSTPRKETPRSNIEGGSVAIGGDQTGIYTSDSPGGWNVIGKSPLQFFSSESTSLSLLQPGDYVKFRAVSREIYMQILDKVSKGSYKTEREVYCD